MELSERDLEILAFERSWWQAGGSKAVAIRQRLGISPGRYRRLLEALVDRPEAELADPLLVRRLKRARLKRRRVRYEGSAQRGAP